MLAYIDPNWLGLPFQAAGPWLIAIIGAAGGVLCTLFFRTWRCLLQTLFVRRSFIFKGLLVSIGLAVLVFGSLIFVGHSSTGEEIVDRQNKTKVLVLGMDGLDPEILTAMMDEGELPAFQRLREQGGFAPLATVSPPQSPVVWSSFATGSNPGVHGIFDFIHRQPQNYSLDLSITSPKPGGGYVNGRRGQTFWKTLSDRGISSYTMFCPCEFPPEKVSGGILAGMGTPDLQGTMGRYFLISTDPTWAEKDLHGDVIGVAFTQDKIRFSLSGTRISSGRSKRDLTVPVDIESLESGDGITLKVQGQDIALKVGQWSPWLRLKFRPGLIRSFTGICRFHLASISPELNLYCTAVQFDPLDPVFDISYPSDLAGELAGELGLFATLGMPLDTKAYEDGVLDVQAFLAMAYSIVDERQAILQHLLEKWQDGVLFFYFGTPDCVQHMVWQDLLKERLAAQGTRSLPEALAAVYQRMDEILAEVLRRLEQEPRTQLIILSDHGFDDFRRALHVNRILADLGYLNLSQNCKTGRPLFRDVDWTRTRAFACGFSSIYLNMQNREGQGIVDPRQKEQLLRSIQKDLLAYVDPETSQQPIQQVSLSSEIYQGPCAGQAPDLIVGCRPGYRFSWQTALGAAPALPVESNNKKWRGDHIFAASSVPGILLIRNAPSEMPAGIDAVAKYILSLFSDNEETQRLHNEECRRG